MISCAYDPLCLVWSMFALTLKINECVRLVFNVKSSHWGSDSVCVGLLFSYADPECFLVGGAEVGEARQSV